MAQKVYKAGVKREKGFLYYLDKKGNVCKVKMARGGSTSKSKPVVVVKTDVVRKEGFLYFIDKQGDVASVKMSRGGRKKKATKKKAAKKRK
jgi:hypothetical protein